MSAIKSSILSWLASILFVLSAIVAKNKTSTPPLSLPRKWTSRGEHTCPKCGGVYSERVRYVGKEGKGDESGCVLKGKHEHLHPTCASCGFVDCFMPADHK